MKNIKKILVAIDRSAMAEEALKRAISIAKEKKCTASSDTCDRAILYRIPVYSIYR